MAAAAAGAPAAPTNALNSWATKYGAHSATDSKRGLTPTQAAFPTLGTTIPLPGSDYEAYQKSKLYGFTTGELAKMLFSRVNFALRESPTDWKGRWRDAGELARKLSRVLRPVDQNVSMAGSGTDIV